MSELRIDPVTGITVVIEPERAGRPRDFRRTPDEVGEASTCPFCLGHEDQTPPSRLELALPGEDHWEVRAFANMFPALVADPDDDGPEDLRSAPWPYQGTTGFGAHELIVETPRHDETLADYSPAHAALLADALSYRIKAWRDDGRFAAAVVFRNYGRAAGASLAHPHTQIMALPRVPDMLVRELGNFVQHAAEGGRCVLCDAVRADDAGDRIVFDDGVTVVHSPWAAPVPYFMRISPRRCMDTIADATSDERASFGAALVAAAKAIRGAFGDAAFNVIIHDAPYSAQHAGLPFHWHAEVLPRATEQAGFEWGSGIYLNVVDPDEAAAKLRAGIAGD